MRSGDWFDGGKEWVIMFFLEIMRVSFISTSLPSPPPLYIPYTRTRLSFPVFLLLFPLLRNEYDSAGLYGKAQEKSEKEEGNFKHIHPLHGKLA